MWTQADQDAANAICVANRGPGSYAGTTPAIGATYTPDPYRITPGPKIWFECFDSKAAA